MKMATTETRQNLKTFYAGMKYGKYDLARRICARTGCSMSTVLNWLKGFNKPRDQWAAEVLSDETGIPVCDLFDRDMDKVE
jgi:hypothetical protein